MFGTICEISENAVLVFDPGMRIPHICHMHHMRYGYAGVVVVGGATSALSDLPRPGRTPEPSNATAQIKLSENSGGKINSFAELSQFSANSYSAFKLSVRQLIYFWVLLSSICNFLAVAENWLGRTKKEKGVSCSDGKVEVEVKRPALAADDAGGGDKEDGGGEDKEDPKSSKDPNHLFRFTCIVKLDVLLDFMMVLMRAGLERGAI